MYAEEELIPISALQHLLFCERQCALIHLERVWQENRLTAEGGQLHRKVHKIAPETRDGVRTTRSLPLRSYVWGLTGQADVITWEPPPDLDRSGDPLPKLLANSSPEKLRGWKITPVEYKRGQPKTNDCDRVQLCAQAICLEEMLGVTIPSGEIFYGKNRRRVRVVFDGALRSTTQSAALRLHEMFRVGITPQASREPKCDHCSLLEICMPDTLVCGVSAKKFVDDVVSKALLERNSP